MQRTAQGSPSTCPLCGEANRCAMEMAKEAGTEPAACWCAAVDFSAVLLARVPAEMARRACICERCARSTGEDRADPQ